MSPHSSGNSVIVKSHLPRCRKPSFRIHYWERAVLPFDTRRDLDTRSSNRAPVRTQHGILLLAAKKDRLPLPQRIIRRKPRRVECVFASRTPSRRLRFEPTHLPSSTRGSSSTSNPGRSQSGSARESHGWERVPESVQRLNLPSKVRAANTGRTWPAPPTRRTRVLVRDRQRLLESKRHLTSSSDGSSDRIDRSCERGASRVECSRTRSRRFGTS